RASAFCTASRGTRSGISSLPAHAGAAKTRKSTIRRIALTNAPLRSDPCETSIRPPRHADGWTGTSAEAVDHAHGGDVEVGLGAEAAAAEVAIALPFAAQGHVARKPVLHAEAVGEVGIVLVEAAAVRAAHIAAELAVRGEAVEKGNAADAHQLPGAAVDRHAADGLPPEVAVAEFRAEPSVRLVAAEEPPGDLAVVVPPDRAASVEVGGVVLAGRLRARGQGDCETRHERERFPEVPRMHGLLL